MAADQTPVLELKTEKQPKLITVWCTGKIVIDTWAKLSTTLRKLIRERKPIRVDMSGVTFVDSVGIGAMVSVWASAKKAGCDFKYRNPNKRVNDVVELTELCHMFEGQ